MLLVVSFISTLIIRAIDYVSSVRSLIKPQCNEGAVLQLTICLVLYFTLAHFVNVYLLLTILPKVLLVLMAITAYFLLSSIQYLGGF